MEAGTQIVAITPSMWLPGWGPGHSCYRNLSSVCHLWSQNDPGERLVLQVLTTLQYLAEVGPKSLPPGHISKCVQSIMWSLQQAEISLMPHAILGYAMSTWSRSTSVKTDISCADISSQLSSVGSAGDMPQPNNRLWLGDNESTMGEMTLDSVSLTGAVEPDVEAVKKNPEAEAQEYRVDKE